MRTCDSRYDELIFWTSGTESDPIDHIVAIHKDIVEWYIWSALAEGERVRVEVNYISHLFINRYPPGCHLCVNIYSLVRCCPLISPIQFDHKNNGTVNKPILYTRSWSVHTRMAWPTYVMSWAVNSSPPEENGRNFADDIFKYIFLNENVCILIRMSMNFVPNGLICNKSALVEVMACRMFGDKPLPQLISTQSIDVYMRN